MVSQTRFYQRHWHSVLLAIFTSMLLASSTLWAGVFGHRQAPEHAERGVGILPAMAEPHGYSLEDLAKVTAAFNVSDHSLPPELVNGSRHSKFQMLFTTMDNTFHVRPNTILYVPVLTFDDSPPVIGKFPKIRDREAVLRYVFSAKQVGLQYSILAIDGQDFPLEEKYLVAVKVPPLPDGGGTGYMVSAAFVKPLKKGSHEVVISGSITGDAVGPWCGDLGFACPDGVSFAVTYNVIVD